MVSKSVKTGRRLLDSESGAVRKSWRGRLHVALVYPNRYHVGMSNLGFQAVYQIFNRFEHVVCERAFLPRDAHPAQRPMASLESGHSLGQFDIIAFSLSFENDYPNILSILEEAKIPLRSRQRSEHHPVVLAGGVACFLNPEPIAAFFDCFLIGEAEAVLPRFVDAYDPGQPKIERLKSLARNVPGVYVPAFYKTEYKDDGTIAALHAVQNVPEKIKHATVTDLSHTPTFSGIITPNTTFENTFLVEVGRGCPHGCRFCSAGFIYRPPRFRPLSGLQENIRRGLELTDRIGLVGAAVSDFPEIDRLCTRFLHGQARLSFSSLRADALGPELLSVLRQSKVKTATIAPEAGSERLRTVINKGICEADILDAAAALVENGIPNLKLYFMIGLPTETEADVAAIGTLCKRIKHRFLQSSRARKRIGTITVSLNCFVPKPVTPFQWAPMDDVNALKIKIKQVKTALKTVANVRVHADIPRWAYIQALLSRGDRKVAEILLLAHTLRENWPQTLKTIPFNPDFYVLRQRYPDEIFPWDFVDHGIKKSFLLQEYQRARQGQTTEACRVESCRRCGVC